MTSCLFAIRADEVSQQQQILLSVGNASMQLLYRDHGVQNLRRDTILLEAKGLIQSCITLLN
jgi:hypothetical protein